MPELSADGQRCPTRQRYIYSLNDDALGGIFHVGSHTNTPQPPVYLLKLTPPPRKQFC